MINPLRLFEEEEPKPKPATEMSKVQRRFRRYGLDAGEQFSEDEWDHFIKCAKAYCGRDGVFHKHAMCRMAERRITNDELMRAIVPQAKVASYRYRGDENSRRLMLWSPEQRCFVVLSLEDGVVLTTWRMDRKRFLRYAAAHQNADLKWLRP